MQTPDERKAAQKEILKQKEAALKEALEQIEANVGKKSIHYGELRPKISSKLASIGYKSALIPFKHHVDALLDEAGDLLLAKQHDYGPLNISRAPGGPLNGLRVRIFDKVSRINNLIDSGVTPKHESLRDSFIDLANYAIIALMVIDEVWPELEKSND